MSSVGLSYDMPTYEQKLHTSIGPGMYQLATPANDCTSCGQDVPSDPYIRWQNWGPGFCAPGSAVDVDSDLSGITRKASKCATDQYHPSKSTVHQGCVAVGKVGVECSTPTEPTRLSNTPCNLRESGNNRWEWLCWDPQQHALERFENNVSYRIIAKDNHVPCLPVPLDQTNVLPNSENYVYDNKPFDVPTPYL